MTSTRDRMLAGAIELICERGVAGVTVDAVVTRSSAPRGSVYYHFPDGRTQIVREAVGRAGSMVTEALTAVVELKPDSHQFLEGVGAWWKQSLSASDFQAGCPLMATAVDGLAEDPGLRDQLVEHFGKWQDSFTLVLLREGRCPEEARSMARLAVAAISGAVVLCRVYRSLEPLDDVLKELDALVVV